MTLMPNDNYDNIQDCYNQEYYYCNNTYVSSIARTIVSSYELYYNTYKYFNYTYH